MPTSDTTPQHQTEAQAERQERTPENGVAEGTFSPVFDGLSLGQRQTIQRQQRVGNQAVMRSLRSRVQRVPPESGTTGGTFTLRLRIPGMVEQRHENVPREQALVILRRFRRSLIDALAGERETHEFLINNRETHWIVGAIADTLAWQSLPPRTIWDAPAAQLASSEAIVQGNDVMAAYRALQAAANAIDQARQQVIAYREGTITGAERAITVLEVTEAAGAAAAVVATGGLATTAIAGAGVAATSATGLAITATTAAGTAGLYGAAQSTAGQGGEMMVGMRQHFDVGAILRRAGTDAVVTFVGAFTGGALTPYIQRLFGSYLATASPQLLRELGAMNGLAGELPRDYFMTTGQRMLADFLANAATTPLTTAVSTVLRRISGEMRETPSPAQFAHMVFDDLVQGGIMGLFFSYATHTMPHSRTPAAGRTGSPTPETAPAGGARETTRAGATNGEGAGTADQGAHTTGSSAPRGGRGSAPEPSVIINDPEMAAQARPANESERAQMRAAEERIAQERRAEQERQRRAQQRQEDPPNPSLWEQVRARLRGNRWQDVMTRTDQGGPEGLAFGDQMLHYRRHIMQEVARLFQGEPVGTASTERTSDVDINMLGDNAGQNMQRAHQWLVEHVGPDYAQMLRLDLLIDNARTTAYRDPMTALPPNEQAALMGRLNNQAEVLNLARMLQHAQHAEPGPARDHALAEVRELAQRLGLNGVEMANVERMARTQPSETVRNQLLNEIDGMVRQLPTITDPIARARLAEQITMKQMEANFHMGEAYIGPGAIRQTVQGRDINVSEAYQAALSHLEMFHHAVGQNHGNSTQAARGYELFKYISRYAQAARAAGIDTPQTNFFRNLGDYIYRANRGANAEGSNPVDLGTQHDDANRHANRGNTQEPFYVTDQQAGPTDAQIGNMVRQFEQYVNETLPMMRDRSRAATAPGSAPIAGAVAAGNETRRN